jgi:hypothetical protein
LLQNFKYVTIEICEQIGPKYWLSDTLNTVHHGTVTRVDQVASVACSPPVTSLRQIHAAAVLLRVRYGVDNVGEE